MVCPELNNYSKGFQLPLQQSLCTAELTGGLSVTRMGV